MFVSYPLSPMQAAMLSASLFDQRSGTYVQQLVIRTRERIDEPAFHAAWTQLLSRHSVLRTSFRWQGLSEPLQVVNSDAALNWSTQDWKEAGSDPESLNLRLEAFLNDDRDHGFDLACAPLHRLALIRMADQGNCIVWTFHHALLDGRGTLLLIEELFEIYAALQQGAAAELDPPVEYRHYIDWLRAQDFSRDEDYWRTLLGSFREPNRILSARATPRYLAMGESRGLVQRWVGGERYAALRTLAERHGVTLNTLVQAAWGLLIAKHSGMRDVVFGTTRSCRKSVPNGEAIVGSLINTVPVRLTIDPEQPLVQLLQELRAQHVSVREHEHTPTARIQEWSGLAAGIPLFTTIVVFENYLMATRLKQKGGAWEQRDFELHEQTDHLILAVYQSDGLLLKLEYNRCLFNDDLIERMLDQYCTVLDSIAARPAGKLRELKVLPAEERQRLLVEWNATASDYPEDATLDQLFTRQAAITPEAAAVESAWQCLSYATLDRRSNQLARLLRKWGVSPDEVVALFLNRGAELAIAFLGVLKAGAAYLPLDPAYPIERLRYMIRDSKAKVVIAGAELAPQIEIPDVRVLRLDSDWESLVANENASALAPVATPDNLAYVMYTSGSSGQPKGVMVPHRGLVNLCVAVKKRFALGASDRVLQYSSISFDCCVEEVYPSWHAGATLVFRNDSAGQSIHEFINWVREKRITVFDVPTAFWNELVQGLTSAGIGLPEDLRLVVVGGEKVSRAVLEAWRAIPGAAQVTWLNTYGPTETTVTSTVYQPRTRDLDFVGDPPIGHPIANTRLYVLDTELEPVPIGVPGELYIAGPGVARGYLGRSEATQQAFVPDRFGPDSERRMYRSGDIVRYAADGMLFFVGRMDTQCKISGFRVEPGEVEEVIERYPGVQQAIVKVIDGEGGRYLAAYLVLSEVDRPGVDEVTAFLRGALPPHMIPRSFIPMDALPMTPGGKVDRKALPHPAALRLDPVCEQSPQDALEAKLLNIFSEIFPGRAVGIRDNFFELGGNSLSAFRLLTKIEVECGACLPFTALTRGGTVQGIAAQIRNRGEEPARRSHLIALQTSGSAPKLFLVHGVGGSVHWYQALAAALRPHVPVYGIQSPGMEEGDDEMVGADIEQLARLYIFEIKTVQAEGPYYLGGHSMGGIIAFEMARQLGSEGDVVHLTVNFDSWNIAADAPSLPQKVVRLGAHFIRLDTDGKLRFLREKLAWLTGATRSRLELGSRHPDAGRLGFMKAANVEAAHRYVPGFLDGTFTIFRAREQSATALDDPLLGWGGLATSIDVVDVPGNHYNLLSEPHVQTLAAELMRRLRSAESSDENLPVSAAA